MRLIITQARAPEWPFARPPELLQDVYEIPPGERFMTLAGCTIVSVYVPHPGETEDPGFPLGLSRPPS